MPCEPIHGGFVCGRRRSRKVCGVCKQQAAVKLCDFPLRGKKAGKTCDHPMCARCAVTVGAKGNDTIDYCRPHAELSGGKSVQLELDVG